MFDLSALSQPHLICGEVPAFQTDWKDSNASDEKAALPWPAVERRLRVRTAIQNGQALDTALFAHELVFADAWHGWFDLSAATEPEKLANALAQLFSHPVLPLLGKTHAPFTLALTPTAEIHQWPAQVPAELTASSTVTVLLQTAAHMLALDDVAGATSHEPMLAAYKKYWCEQSGGALELSHCFATDQLVGGDYLYHRRIKKLPTHDGKYRPFLLTQAGSVFVLKVMDVAKALGCLNAWQASGMPIGKSAAEKHGCTWQSNPFIPAHGYGEVCINPKFDVPPPDAGCCTAVNAVY